MEIKINCLRNGINGGGASNGPTTLLDGYGTYLYDLYKPSDEDVAAHPELADEPLGIAFPTGNLVKTIQYSYEIQDYYVNDSITTKCLQQVRSIFMPHMYRETFTDQNEETIKNYLQSNTTLLIENNYFSNGYGIYCAGTSRENIEPTIPSIDYNSIFLSNVKKLGTYVSSSFDDFSGINPWREDTTTGISIYNMPMFMFLPLPQNNVKNYYNVLFSDGALSAINEADREYYKKSAVLIYKKDLMDFKNFFKKMMDYGAEINAYSQKVLESLQKPQN